MVADALSHKAESTPLRDVCLRLTVIAPVLDAIRGAQAEAVQPEMQKKERVVGLVSEFVTDGRGLMPFQDRIWVPFLGGTRTILMEEAHRSKFSIHPGATKNVLGPKKGVLVALYEKGCCMVC